MRRRDFIAALGGAAATAAVGPLAALGQETAKVTRLGYLAPARLPLRDDLRTRLGHGLVFEVVALADDDKAAALAVYARERGFGLSGDVIGYLLAHGRRDMASLVAALAALDRMSLSAKRPISVALLREWLQQPGASGKGG